MLEGELLEEIFTQLSMGTSQPVEVGQVVTHLLKSFTSSSRKWLSGRSPRWVLRGQNPGHADPIWPGSGSSVREGWLP